MSKLKIITKLEEVDELIAHCKTTGRASIDFETSDTKYYSDLEYPLMLGVSFQPGSAWIIPLAHKDSPLLKNGWEKALKKFGKEVIENWDIVKIAWNLKFEYKWFMRYGIFMKGILYDGMLAKYCLDEERPHDLKDFVATFFPKYANYEDEIDKKVPWAQKDFNKLAIYCGLDCDLTHRGMIYLEKKLIEHKFYNLFRNLLMMISRVLAESEFRGIYVDREYLMSLCKVYKDKIEECKKKLSDNPAVRKFEAKTRRAVIRDGIKNVQAEIDELMEQLEDDPSVSRKIAHRQNKLKHIAEGILTKKETYQGFNFDSPKQLTEFLFTSKYGLGLESKKKTKGGSISSDEEVLESLKPKDKSGFIDNILELRGLNKIDGTYVRGMLPHLDNLDRAHATFHVHGTVTGRLSCVKPNLQNIPRGTTASDIKKMFIPPPGYLLIEVDYGQAELRVVAELADDENMLDIFRRGHNIHVATACKMFKGDYEEVKKILKDEKHPDWLKWEKQKKIGKSLNFSILYMQGDEATAETLKCSIKKAKEFKAEWLNQFPNIAIWIKKQIKFAHANEYVPTMFGRKRRLYDINSSKGYLSAEQERQSVNAPIQSASGDFTLVSQIVIREKILNGELPRELHHVYTVHDSIGYYCPPHLIHKVMKPIITICDNPQTQKYFGFELKKVAMKVSPEVGVSWVDLKDYDPWEKYEKWV